MPRQIYITEADLARLKKLINDAFNKGELRNDKSFKDLEREIEHAKMVSADQLPQNVITMNSKALILLDGDEEEISLVYPQDADFANKKISVLSPIGVAILGYSEGDTVEWEVPSGITEIYIKKILYQPEASGDFYL